MNRLNHKSKVCREVKHDEDDDITSKRYEEEQAVVVQHEIETDNALATAN